MIFSYTSSKPFFSRVLSFGLPLFLLFSFSDVFAKAEKQPPPPPPVRMGKKGLLEYQPDSLGNRVPDFSYCGYMAGDVVIPYVPAKLFVPLKTGDATARIQAAIDYVSTLPADVNGFKGAVQLEAGTYQIDGGLVIHSSGIILRGSGMGEANGTILFGAGRDRETLISLEGLNDIQLGKGQSITDSYIPVNAFSFHVANAASLKKGDKIRIHRPATKEWILELDAWHFGGGETTLGWKPGEREIYWDRTITKINGTEITIDAPLTTALDATYGGATVTPYTWAGKINHVGVENLRCVSDYDKSNPKDELHRWMAITVNNAEDGWVRQVTFEHFVGSAVAAWEGTKRFTVEDCESLSPVGEIGGQRRNTFWTMGQQTLFQRLYSEHGFHDFSVGYCAPGPNAFVQCNASLPYSFSGAIDSWASGVLFDVVNIDGNALSYANHSQDRQGSGWCAANSMFWQCSAAMIECYAPPTAQNWAFGSWSQFKGDGYWNSSNEHIRPWSLYYAQLKDRLNDSGVYETRPQFMLVPGEASSSPSVEVAQALSKEAMKRFVQLPEWIEAAGERNKITTETNGVKSIDDVKLPKKKEEVAKQTMSIKNGWIVFDGNIITGKQHETPWWRGDVRPYEAKKAQPAITRYVPGRTGTGHTDNLDSVINWMERTNTAAFLQHYGLWYERRRDDHERIRRMDGDVWPPFYELPFARTGQSSAWDGLSKYDLTTYNYWYWNRMKQFANKAEEKGMVLIYENYFQHNIIEAGAHYADFPWRTANNVNNTGFPEPPPYAGDKRIFMAEQFYDTTQTHRWDLHRTYIFKCLDNFKDNSNVIQMTSEEYTGPLPFVQFWLNTVSEWQAKNNKKEIIALSTTKDVQDSILANPKYRDMVDVIDIRYWQYQYDDVTYAPKGGQNLAPRQHARLLKPRRSDFAHVYKAVYEYKTKYPDKAVTYFSDGWDKFGWASFIAGGSITTMPHIEAEGFTAAAAKMHPMAQVDTGKSVWMLGNDKNEYIVYMGDQARFDTLLSELPSSMVLTWIDPNTGKTINTEKIRKSKASAVKIPREGEVVLWISRN